MADNDHTDHKKTNGSGLNGSGDKDENDSVVGFPTLADRDRMRKEKQKEEQKWRKEYRKANSTPFLNMDRIAPFVKFIVPAMLFIHVVTHYGFDPIQRFNVYLTFGVVPAYFGADFQPLSLISPITHMFLHGGWFHIAMNLAMLSVLSTFFDRDFGNTINVKFFLACGIAGAAIHILVNWGSDFPLIGSSGAVSGYFSAFLLMNHWRGAVLPLGRLSQYGIWPLVGFWLFIVVGLGILMGGTTLSWEAHLGGFLCGMFLTSYYARGHFKFWR